VASARLDDERGRGEQGRELGEHLRGPLQVDAARQHQHRRAGTFFTRYITVALNAATGQQDWSVLGPGASDGGQGPTAVAVSPDGSQVFVTGRAGTIAYASATGVQLWDDPYKVQWHRYPGQLAVSPGSSAVYVTSPTSEGGKIHYITTAYATATGAQLWVARYDAGTLAAIAVSPDGSPVFVTGSGRHGFATIAYNAATGARLWLAPSPAVGTAIALAVSPDGSKVFATGGATGTGGDEEYSTKGYSTATGSPLWTAQYGQAGTSFAPVSLGVSSDDSSVIVTGTGTPASGHSQFATVAYGS